jgi:hypothetical protein
LNAVGFCAHYSQQGDWAFDYALRLAEKHSLRLNVFHFLADPYDPDDRAPEWLPKDEFDKLAVERERELRMYYDERAGDYLDVGFRLCYDDSWKELHRCLMIREFQLLVLGYVGTAAIFAGKPIEEFADSFVCPAVLVGPEHFDDYWLNSQAALLVDRLDLADGNWIKIGHSVTRPFGR